MRGVEKTGKTPATLARQRLAAGLRVELASESRPPTLTPEMHVRRSRHPLFAILSLAFVTPFVPATIKAQTRPSPVVASPANTESIAHSVSWPRSLAARLKVTATA